jgi:hypothetical protein
MEYILDFGVTPPDDNFPKVQPLNRRVRGG